MEFKRIRGNALILFDSIAKIPILLAVVLIGFFLSRDYDYSDMIYLVFFLVSPLFGIGRYLSTYYTIEDAYLLVETGIWNKKQIKIPIAQITTVDLTQNLLYRVLGAYRIKVDNASQTSDTINKSEIKLALKASQALAFKQQLLQGISADMPSSELKSDYVVIGASFTDFLKLGLLQSKFTYLTAGGPLTVIFINLFLEKATGGMGFEESLNWLLLQFSLISIILSVVILICGIALILSITKSLLTYYRFQVSNNENTLIIEYGLINKKKFTFPKNKINGVLIRQNLLMRIFGYCTAEIVVIGYGDQSGEGEREQSILYPIASVRKMKEIINLTLPAFVMAPALCQPMPAAIKYFFFRPGLILMILALSVALIVQNIIVIAVTVCLVFLVAVSSWLQYRNAGIHCGDTNVTVSSGGYEKTISLIKISAIECITSTGGHWKRKKGIVTIGIGFLAPLREAHVTAYNLPVGQFNLLEERIPL